MKAKELQGLVALRDLLTQVIDGEKSPEVIQYVVGTEGDEILDRPVLELQRGAKLTPSFRKDTVRVHDDGTVTYIDANGTLRIDGQKAGATVRKFEFGNGWKYALEVDTKRGRRWFIDGVEYEGMGINARIWHEEACPNFLISAQSHPRVIGVIDGKRVDWTFGHGWQIESIDVLTDPPVIVLKNDREGRRLSLPCSSRHTIGLKNDQPLLVSSLGDALIRTSDGVQLRFSDDSGYAPLPVQLSDSDLPKRFGVAGIQLALRVLHEDRGALLVVVKNGFQLNHRIIANFIPSADPIGFTNGIACEGERDGVSGVLIIGLTSGEQFVPNAFYRRNGYIEEDCGDGSARIMFVNDDATLSDVWPHVRFDRADSFGISNDANSAVLQRLPTAIPIANGIIDGKLSVVFCRQVITHPSWGSILQERTVVDGYEKWYGVVRILETHKRIVHDGQRAYGNKEKGYDGIWNIKVTETHVEFDALRERKILHVKAKK